MTKKRKRIALVLVYMLLVIGGVNLTDFAQSHAYFTTNNKDNPLKYQANVISAYQKTNLYLDSNKPKTKTKAPFVFTFDINSGVNTNTPDKYTVTPPTSCTVTGMSGSAESSKTSSITLPALTDGSNTEYRTGKIKVEMSCDLIIGQDREFTASVTETVKGKTFKYADTEVYKLIYSEYSKDISLDVTDSYGPVTGNEIELFEEFKVWIKNYAQQYYTDVDFNNEPMSGHIINYAINENQGVFKNYKDFKVALDKAMANGSDTTSLPGISISYDAKKKAYTFKTQANLLGYARTYRSYLGLGSNANLIFFFDSKDEKVINQAFDYYLTNYIFKDSSVNIEDVKKYINSQSSKGIVGVVLDKIPVLGIYNAHDGYEFDAESILKYMAATYPIAIQKDTESNMKFYLNDILSLKQFKDDAASAIVKDILNNKDSEEYRRFYNVLMILQKYDPPRDILRYVLKEPTETENYYTLLMAWSDQVTKSNLKIDRFVLPEGYKVYKWNMVAESDGTYPRLQIIIESESDYGSVNWSLADSIVRNLGLDPDKLAYGSITDGKEYSAAVSGKKMYIDLAESALLTHLNSLKPIPLTEYTQDDSVSTVNSKKPTINSNPEIPPLEVGDSSTDKEENKDSEEKVENSTETENDTNTDEEEKEINVPTDEETKNYPSENVVDNPNKDEDNESSMEEQIPKIK